MLLVPSPCPCPSRVAFVFGFVPVFSETTLEPQWAALLWKVRGGTRALKTSTPRWRLSRKDIAMADAWTSVVAEPVPSWGRLASGSGFPAHTRAGDTGISQTRLRLSLLPARPLISPPPALIVSTSLCPWSLPGSRRRLVLAGGSADACRWSSVGSVNRDSLSQCNVCRVLLKL